MLQAQRKKTSVTLIEMIKETLEIINKKSFYSLGLEEKN